MKKHSTSCTTADLLSSLCISPALLYQHKVLCRRKYQIWMSNCIYDSGGVENILVQWEGDAVSRYWFLAKWRWRRGSARKTVRVKHFVWWRLLINRLHRRKIWGPFNNTLHFLKSGARIRILIGLRHDPIQYLQIKLSLSGGLASCTHTNRSASFSVMFMGSQGPIAHTSMYLLKIRISYTPVTITRESSEKNLQLLKLWHHIYTVCSVFRFGTAIHWCYVH